LDSLEEEEELEELSCDLFFASGAGVARGSPLGLLEESLSRAAACMAGKAEERGFSQAQAMNTPLGAQDVCSDGKTNNK